jgi:hypothetical protein
MIPAGLLLLLFGAAMATRGFIYTRWPTGKIAEKRKRKNLKYGMPTDMRVFGKRIRRLGLLIALAGGWLVAWDLSDDVPSARVEERGS